MYLCRLFSHNARQIHCNGACHFRYAADCCDQTGCRPMRLTTFSDYCLRVLMYLAADEVRPATIGEIAVAFGISRNHLTKVVHFLGRSGYLTNVRGRGGGIALARSPKAMWSARNRSA